MIFIWNYTEKIHKISGIIFFLQIKGKKQLIIINAISTIFVTITHIDREIIVLEPKI